MIDLHCHALPGIDDGPATVAEALALARMQVAVGVTTVVATPHVHHDYPANTSVTIARDVIALRAEIEREGIPLELLPGAEVSLLRAIDLPDEELAALRLGGGPWLLLEPPFAPTSAAGVAEALFRLQARGHRIMLAHPERCAVFQQNPELVGQCVERGMLVSITAGALVGRFGRTVQRLATGMVRDGLVHDVASDAHGTDPRRPPGIRAELQETGLAAETDRLCRASPAAVLSGAAVPSPASLAGPARGGVLSRLLRRA